MSQAGFVGGQYQPLSKEQIITIHSAALKILAETGFTYENGLEEVLDLLSAAGMMVDREAGRIYFPKHIISELIERSPSRVLLCGRETENDLNLKGDHVYLGTGGAAIWVLDLNSGQLRDSTLKDIYDMGRLADRLRNIHFYLRPCIPKDIDKELYDENVFYACFKATGKHVMAGVNDEKGLDTMLNMAAGIAGKESDFLERPFASVITSFAISPLKLCTQSTKIMMAAVRQHVPVALSCAPMAGSTSPITMAGTLVLTHAEQLAGIALAQVVSPGAPVLYGGIPGMANLNNLGYLGGAVEFGIMNAAIHQLAKHINVPNYNSSGLSDAKIPDAQAGWEKGMSTLLVAMGGSNYVHHAAGMLDSMLAVSYEQLVIDDEIIGMSNQVLKGIEVDPEHLALDVIDEIGPGNAFIKSKHTRKHMLSEYYTTNGVTNRKKYERWVGDGSPDTWDRARRIAQAILSESEQSYLPESVDAWIRKTYDIRLYH